ncbi:MAG: hypothetical protein IEMM0008_1738 [bacterium]|nr:MAG: hypothetical protein IEMM0008_1738 [bacterium]
MKRKWILLNIIFLVNIALSHCSKEIHNLSIPNKQVPLIPNMDEKYALISQKTQKQIGIARIRVKSYKTADRLFYEMKSLTKLQKVYKENHQILELFIESTSIIDYRFKLRSFKSRFIRNREQSIRSGYYKWPYFYVKEDDKKARIYSPKGIFSSLVERYFIHNELKKQGDAAIFHFLNIVSLKPEQERIVFESKKIYNSPSGKLPVNIFNIINYTIKYNSTYWVSKDNKVLRKSDFKGAVMWHLLKTK